MIGQTARKAELETANRLLNDQLDNQLKHYSALVDQYEDNRRIRHDIAHHMHTIQLLLESDRHQEATAYAGELMRQQEHSSQLGQCENPLVDAFLFSRIREARQAGIPVEASVVLPRKLPIANVDLVILFGNLMDNAVEACGQVASPFIRLEAGLRKDYLVVTETNPAPADDTRKKRRIPQLERGIGLHILADLAGRYHGSCTQEVRDGQFTVSIALQLPENQGETAFFHKNILSFQLFFVNLQQSLIINVMNKEIGKWFLDVAKYIVTAFLLTRMFVKIDTFFTIFCALLTVVAFFALGIYFLDKDKNNDNKQKGD